MRDDRHDLLYVYHNIQLPRNSLRLSFVNTTIKGLGRKESSNVECTSCATQQRYQDT